MELLQGLGDIAEDISNLVIQVAILTEPILLHSLNNLTVDVFFSFWLKHLACHICVAKIHDT